MEKNKTLSKALFLIFYSKKYQCFLFALLLDSGHGCEPENERSADLIDRPIVALEKHLLFCLETHEHFHGSFQIQG
jgi:hypothetical protein